MKRTLLVLGLIGALTFGVAGPADAGCHSFGCVNKKIKSLKRQNKKLTTQVNRLADDLAVVDYAVFQCEQVTPVTSYGSSFGDFGYLYDANDGSGPFLTSALDYTTTGTEDTDDFMVVDTCQFKAKRSGLRRATPHLGGTSNR